MPGLKDRLHQRKRVFVGIGFSPKVKEEIYKNLIKPLTKKYPQIKWEKEEKLHLTLKFLGYCSNRKIRGVVSILKTTLKDISPFELRIGRLGYFLSHSFIVFVTVSKRRSLLRLFDSLDKNLNRIGFKKEKRDFFPHITLGRGKKKLLTISQWRFIGEKIEKEIGGNIAAKVEEIALFQSLLTPQGSVYKKIEVIRLSKDKPIS